VGLFSWCRHLFFGILTSSLASIHSEDLIDCEALCENLEEGSVRQRPKVSAWMQIHRLGECGEAWGRVQMPARSAGVHYEHSFELRAGAFHPPGPVLRISVLHREPDRSGRRETNTRSTFELTRTVTGLFWGKSISENCSRPFARVRTVGGVCVWKKPGGGVQPMVLMLCLIIDLMGGFLIVGLVPDKSPYLYHVFSQAE
jgi:hypothetical protein